MRATIEATLLTDSLTTDSRLTGLIIYAFWAVYCNRPPLESGVCGSAAAVPVPRAGEAWEVWCKQTSPGVTVSGSWRRRERLAPEFYSLQHTYTHIGLVNKLRVGT